MHRHTHRIRTFVAALALLAAVPAFGYKEQIHRVISLKAFDRTTVELKDRLGVSNDAPIGGTLPRVFVGQGAYDEDDVPNPLNHFFDPSRNAGLRVPFSLCTDVGQTAPHWVTDGFSQNMFTVKDARELYRAALVTETNAQRQQYLRDLFLTLGHALHMIQDMAQPEHTRNDQHLDHSHQVLGNGTAPSIYEEWTFANLLGLNPAVPYDGYPNVKLPNTVAYFANTDGQGLAQFANRSFVTQDTNYDDEQRSGRCVYHQQPAEADAVPRTELVSEYILDAFGGTHVIPVLERVYTSFPHDSYIPRQEVDPNHTFLSSVDLETHSWVGSKYSLADQSYLSRAALLLPRAVGYSAGFLDHFFRGQIEAEWKKNPAGGGWDIRITNRSATEAIGAGTYIEAVYAPGSDYLGGSGSDVMKVLDDFLGNYVGGFNGVPPGGHFTIPNVTIHGLHAGDDPNAFERRIVLRGPLGDEPEDVIGLVQPPASPIVVTVTTADSRPMPLSTQVRIYVAEPNDTNTSRTEGTLSNDGLTVTASRVVSSTASFRIVLFHTDPISPPFAPPYFAIKVHRDGQLLHEVHPGPYLGEYFLTECLPDWDGVAPVLKPTGGIINPANVYGGICGVNFFYADPLEATLP